MKISEVEPLTVKDFIAKVKDRALAATPSISTDGMIDEIKITAHAMIKQLSDREVFEMCLEHLEMFFTVPEQLDLLLNDIDWGTTRGTPILLVRGNLYDYVTDQVISALESGEEENNAQD